MRGNSIRHEHLKWSKSVLFLFPPGIRRTISAYAIALFREGLHLDALSQIGISEHD